MSSQSSALAGDSASTDNALGAINDVVSIGQEPAPALYVQYYFERARPLRAAQEVDEAELEELKRTQQAAGISLMSTGASRAGDSNASTNESEQYVEAGGASTPYNAAEHATCEKQYQHRRRNFLKLLPLAIFLLIKAGLVVIGTGLELGFLHQIFELAFEPLPGEAASWSPWLLALTGVSMVAAFHVHAMDSPNALAVRFIRWAVDFCLPLYVLGMCGAVATIVHQNAAGIFQFAAASTQRLFSSEPAASSSFLASLLPHFGGIFAIAIGVFALLNLFMLQRLIESMHGDVLTIFNRRTDYRCAHQDIVTIRAIATRISDLSRRLATRALELQGLPLVTATEIVAEIHCALISKVQWVDEQRRLAPPARNRLVPQEPRIPVEPVARSVAKLQAITPEQVLKHITSILGTGENS